MTIEEKLFFQTIIQPIIIQEVIHLPRILPQVLPLVLGIRLQDQGGVKKVKIEK